MSNNTCTVKLRTTYPDFGLRAREESGISSNLLHERLALRCKSPEVVFSAGEKKEPVSVFDWHRGMGHCSMQPIEDMEKGATARMVLKDVPEDIPGMDTCVCQCAGGAGRAGREDARNGTTGVDPWDLVGPMPVESVSKYKYSFVLMDDYSRASWVLLLRAK